MDIYKQVACLLLWSVSAFALSATAPPSTVVRHTEINTASLPGAQVFNPQVKAGRYWVQIHAANIVPSIERFTRFFSADRIVIHKGRDNIIRVMVGPLKTFSEVVRAQQRAQDNGINDAFIRFSERPDDVISSRYWVQLYATKKPVNYSSLIQLRSLTQIKVITNDKGYNRVLTGPFGSYQEAETICHQSQRCGTDGAFVLRL